MQAGGELQIPLDLRSRGEGSLTWEACLPAGRQEVNTPKRGNEMICASASDSYQAGIESMNH